MKTPINHCASSMMHSEAWNEMRKNNSPNTIGNEAGIAHNKKMREAIGTFKMPHSSSALNQNDNCAKAWDKFKSGYTNRKTKTSMKKVDGKYQKVEVPVSAEANLAEYNAEKNEFECVDGKIKLKKTDDADIAIERKSSNGKDGLAPYKSISDIQKTYDDNMAYAKNQLNKGKLSQKNYDSFVEEEKAMLKDWKTRKAMESAELFGKGRGSGLFKKEGKKDACYHKVKKAVKVWPSAYASGQLVQCRKRGASNWGVGKKK